MSVPHTDRPAGGAPGSVSRWPFAVVGVLLALMVIVPYLAGVRREGLRTEIESRLTPARTGLLETQRVLAYSVAATRGYLVTRETAFLSEVGRDLAAVRRASERFAEASTRLGPEAAVPRREFLAATAGWVAYGAALADASVDPAGLAATLRTGQAHLARTEAAAESVAAALDGIEADARRRIRASERGEDALVAALGLTALLVCLLIARQMKRLGAHSLPGVARAETRTAHQSIGSLGPYLAHTGPGTEEERERLLESERRARAVAEAALHLRDRVLRIVSHDLKDPLHTIGLVAGVLELPLPKAERARQVEIIRRTVDRADRMVLDLLDAARVESGSTIPVELEPVDVTPLLAEVAEAFRLRAEGKRQLLTCEVEPDVVSVLADRDRLLQVLTNLLGNAVKFTPEGGRIILRAKLGGAGEVQFSVADTGSGIPAELQPELFEPFAQAKDSASLGTGLGLSIARGIVAAHSGRIWVESPPGEGATFHFTMPADASSPACMAIPQASGVV